MGKIHKSGKNHCLIRSAKNKSSGKYVRQRERTERNRKAKALKHYLKFPNDKQAWARILEKGWNRL